MTDIPLPINVETIDVMPQAVTTVEDATPTLAVEAVDATTTTTVPGLNDDRYIVHNVKSSGAYPARPSGAVCVFWIGDSDPGPAAHDGDVWIDTAP